MTVRKLVLSICILALSCTQLLQAETKKILFIAGKPSHASGEHEHRAGCMLLAKALNESGLDVEAKVHYYGWPEDESILEGVDGLVIYADAGGHIDKQAEKIDKMVKDGMGIMFIHYDVHPTKETGEKYYKEWIGGFFDEKVSVNPHWIADLTPKKGHPVSRGLPEKFLSFDEFYYNMNFKHDCEHCQSLADATPTLENIIRYNNVWHKEGELGIGKKQSLMWCRDVKGRGRGVGFTGGHYHKNWAIDSFRKLVLKSIVWMARMEVPKEGVPSKAITEEELNKNLDVKKGKQPKRLTLWDGSELKQIPDFLPSINGRGVVSRPPKNEWPPKQAPRHVDVRNFVVPDGYEVTVWAKSPMLYNPANMDVDAEGRIWVTEGVNYRKKNGRRKEGDRIVVLEDTDKDGKADKSHVFHQSRDLVCPLGISVFDNKIVVAHAPYLIVYTDVNRDLKFDPAIDKKETLLNGFNAGNHDHSLHAVVSGPDGKWYINNGNCGAIFTDRSGKTFRMNSPYTKSGPLWPARTGEELGGAKSDDGYVWTSGFTARIDADGKNAEIVGHGYRNSYENILNSYGDLFQNDNDDPPACRNSYVLEYGNAGFFTRDGLRYYKAERREGQSHQVNHWRQEDPGTFDVGDIYGGGSPTGVAYYENGAMGDQFIGAYLSCEAGKNVVFGYKPEMKGATYTMKRGDFLTSNPNKLYAGSDFLVWSGDNQNKQKQAVISEFKGEVNPVEFRPSDVMVGVDGAIYVADWLDERVGGHSTHDLSCSGMIYRIAPKGFKSSVPKVDYNTVEGQLTALKSPANNVRWKAFHMLKDGDASVLQKLKELADTEKNRFVGARALWIMPHHGEKGIAMCAEYLKHEAVEYRLTAYRALRREVGDILPYAKQMMNDVSPAVRRDVALSLRSNHSTDAVQILAALSAKVDENDKNAVEAIGLGSEGNETAVWKAVLASQGEKNALKWSPKMAKLTWRLWNPEAIPALRERALSKELSIEQRRQAVDSLAFINHVDAANALCDVAVDTKDIAKYAKEWLLIRATGEWGTEAWKKHNLGKKLAELKIYDPANIKVSPITVPVPPEKAKYSVADVMKLKGDADKGKTTIMRCVMCHEINGAGANYGPNLKGFGSSQSREVLIRAIVDPSADISLGYEGNSIHLKDGGQVHGIIQTKGDPTIITSTGGVKQYIPKDRVLKKGGIRGLKYSLMLSADQLSLKAQDVADIVEYMKKY